MGKPVKSHAEILETKNIVYDERHPRRCLLDVFRPKTVLPEGQKRKVIIVTHGGAWTVSNKDTIRNVSISLCEEGFIVVAPSYRLSGFVYTYGDYVFANFAGMLVVLSLLLGPKSEMLVLCLLLFLSVLMIATVAFPKEQNLFPSQVHDLAKVTRWTKDHIGLDPWFGDTSHVDLLGYSAGGHLSVLLAYNPRYLNEVGIDQSYVSKVVGISGVYSDVRLAETSLGNKILRGTFGRSQQYYEAFPIWHCRPQNPSTLLVNSELDFSLHRHTLDLAVALLQQGVEVETFVVNDTHHFNVNSHIFTTELLQRILKFLN